MKNMYQFKIKSQVAEVENELQKLVKRGYMEKHEMTKIVKQFSTEKENAGSGQKFATFWI